MKSGTGVVTGGPVLGFGVVPPRPARVRRASGRAGRQPRHGPPLLSRGLVHLGGVFVSEQPIAGGASSRSTGGRSGARSSVASRVVQAEHKIEPAMLAEHGTLLVYMLRSR